MAGPVSVTTPLNILPTLTLAILSVVLIISSPSLLVKAFTITSPLSSTHHPSSSSSSTFSTTATTSTTITTTTTATRSIQLYSYPPAQGGGGGDEEEDFSSEDGSSLASDFFKTLQSRNIELNEDDFIYDDEEDDEDDEDMMTMEDDEEEEEEINFPQGAINAFTGYDAGGVGKLEGNVTLTNEQVYSALKDRVLESAGSFIDLVGGANEDEDEEDANQPKVYKTPETVPDSSLTAGEVVTTVLEALNNNNVPSPNRGIVVLFGYSSSGSAIAQAIEGEGMTAAEYVEFLKEENEYKVLFDHSEVIIDKGDYSFDKKKAFFTARLRIGPGPLDFTSVNFILSTQGHEEDDCWLIDSLLIRPEGMRRRRRR